MYSTGTTGGAGVTTSYPSPSPAVQSGVQIKILIKINRESPPSPGSRVSFYLFPHQKLLITMTGNHLALTEHSGKHQGSGYNLITYLVNNCRTISWLALNGLFAEAEGRDITGCNISRPIWCGVCGVWSHCYSGPHCGGKCMD